MTGGRALPRWICILRAGCVNKKRGDSAVNKCENERAAQSGIAEAYALGLGEPVAISAEHGLGMEDLYHLLDPYFAESEEEATADGEENENFDDLDDLEGLEDYIFAQEETILKNP
ncbi:MAG: hypothetical protein R3D66_05565 [Alphaproteobacteria bacterium]